MVSQRSDEIARGSEFGVDWATNGRRSVVEQCVGWLKECRRGGARFDKLASSFLSFVKLAIIWRNLGLLDASDRA